MNLDRKTTSTVAIGNLTTGNRRRACVAMTPPNRAQDENPLKVAPTMVAASSQQISVVVR